MALVDLIRKRSARTASAISATPATGRLRGDTPVAAIATVAVADESKTTARGTAPMSGSEAQALLEWLVQIGESDQAVIADVLRDCQRDPGTRVFFLNLATEGTKDIARVAALGENGVSAADA